VYIIDSGRYVFVYMKLQENIQNFTSVAYRKGQDDGKVKGERLKECEK
jgi:hypothetical protein